jgi:hypothetical protein
MTFEVKKLATAMLAVASVTVCLQSAHAYPAVPAPLEGRTITGARVDAYDPSAVMEYDPNLDITWLRDWGASGRLTWQNAVNWLETLNVATFANWTLATGFEQPSAPWCNGAYLNYGCAGGRLGYLYFVELGNPFSNRSNAGPFINMDGDGAGYWVSSGGVFASGSGSVLAWDAVNPYPCEIIAIRAGDVAAPIPEPETWAMMLIGLAAGVVTLRKRT